MQFSRCSDIGQSFAPIGLHKTDAASDWLLIKRHYLSKKGLSGVQVQKYSDYISYWRHFSTYRKEDVLFQPKIRGASEKFKNQPRPLLRPRSVNFRQHFRNLSRKTVPSSFVHGARPGGEHPARGQRPPGGGSCPRRTLLSRPPFLRCCLILQVHLFLNKYCFALRCYLTLQIHLFLTNKICSYHFALLRCCLPLQIHLQYS